MDTDTITRLLVALAATARTNAGNAPTETDDRGCSYASTEGEAWTAMASTIESALYAAGIDPEADAREFAERRARERLAAVRAKSTLCIEVGSHVIGAGHNRSACYLTVGE